MLSRPPSQPKRADLDPEDLEPYDAVIGRMRRMVGDAAPPEGEEMQAGEYFGAMLNSPPLCWIASQMGTFVRTAGNRPNTYSHADREFVDQILSKDFQTNVVNGTVHLGDAVGAGVRIEAIAAIRQGREEELDKDERLLAKYIRQVVSGTVDDETWNAMQERLGVRGVIEYTGFILWLQWIMRMMQALGTSAPSEEEIDEIIRQLQTGEMAAPDIAGRLV